MISGQQPPESMEDIRESISLLVDGFAMANKMAELKQNVNEKQSVLESIKKSPQAATLDQLREKIGEMNEELEEVMCRIQTYQRKNKRNLRVDDRDIAKKESKEDTDAVTEQKKMDGNLIHMTTGIPEPTITNSTIAKIIAQRTERTVLARLHLNEEERPLEHEVFPVQLPP